MTVFNPFDYLGSEAAKIVADGWTAVMVSFWSAGLWVLKFVLTIVDAFMTPDISQGGPAAEMYRVTFWMGVALLSVLVMVQLGVAAFKRNGESLARLLIGVGQFVLVWAAWLSYAGVVIAGAGGLTTALLQTLLGVDTWAAWQPTQAFSTEDITDGTLATVLGFMGLFLWLASIGHFIVMLARAAGGGDDHPGAGPVGGELADQFAPLRHRRFGRVDTVPGQGRPWSGRVVGRGGLAGGRAGPGDP